MNQVFSLYGYFRFRWVLRRGFWKLLWFGMVANLGYIVVTCPEEDGAAMSVGTLSPDQDLWNAGYRTCLAGIVFGQPILFYEKETTTL